MADTPNDLKLNEWQTDEKRLPTLTLDEQGNPSIGERVVKQRYTYVPLIPHRICEAEDHRYTFVDGGRRQQGQVLVKCRHCPVGKIFVPGYHKLDDGRLLLFHQP